MDIYDWFIANLHQMLGHAKAAAYLGVPVGDKSTCRLCNPDAAVERYVETGTVDRRPLGSVVAR